MPDSQQFKTEAAVSVPETLYGDTIVLRKARLGDGDALYNNIWSDRSITDKMFFPPSVCRDEIPDRIERTVRFQSDKPSYVVAMKDTDEAIGLTGIKEESEGVYSEAGICVAVKHQKQGIGKEILRLLLELAFDTMGAKQFLYYCMTDNSASKSLAKHYGFIYESAEREVRKHDEKEFEIEKYTLDRAKYYSVFK